MGLSIDVSHVVSAPADRVWAVLADLDAVATTLTGADRIERVAVAERAVEC